MEEKGLDAVTYKQRLSPPSRERQKTLLKGREDFHAWTMTANSQGTYDNMRVGDLVLFAPKGTGRFTWRGTVRGKLESRALGEVLWPFDAAHPWSLVYLLEDVRQTNYSKERLVAEFGYDRGFRGYGITRVGPERVRGAITRHGSLEAVRKASEG